MCRYWLAKQLGLWYSFNCWQGNEEIRKVPIRILEIIIQPRNERKDIVNTLSALNVNEAPRASFRHALKPMAAVKTQEINFLDQAPANWYRVGTLKLM